LTISGYTCAHARVHTHTHTPQTCRKSNSTSKSKRTLKLFSREETNIGAHKETRDLHTGGVHSYDTTHMELKCERLNTYSVNISVTFDFVVLSHSIWNTRI